MRPMTGETWNLRWRGNQGGRAGGDTGVAGALGRTDAVT